MQKDTVLIKKIEDVAKAAGTIMAEASGSHIKAKSGHANFCTETDEKIQEFLVKELGKIIPDAMFVGEEEDMDAFTEKMAHGFTFVVDPIDGTSNFIYGYRPSVVSIGLLKEGAPYIGVVYNPFANEMYHARAGCGAYMNDEPISSSSSPLSDSLSVFGTAPYYTELQDRTFDLAKKLMPLCVDIRRSGTAAWDFCSVAAGRCGLYFEMRMQLWDYAAAALIATEAGCTVTDIEGNALSYRGASSALCLSKGVSGDLDLILNL